ncbi:chemotaxis protein CheB [Sandarakinorhabdus limnophila]|uniref:chemotaxis protein CheB n=1 Tax=Sandarakinorhabdus limnophila TaxID=210512 RepID=UPI0026E9D6F3|nr:chemotaxis protein CheB [Sandarakinorhabdus limnophila]
MAADRGASVIAQSGRLVVGIAASAGGLTAYEAFFAAMPADSGMVFVLVQHLDPEHDSALAEILAGYTAMPVDFARDRMIPAPNTITIIPPCAVLTIHEGRLRLIMAPPVKARRMVVDLFLVSLADDQGPNAVGIILSGYGRDGTAGIAAIKERGGLTMCEAAFDHHSKLGMPQSAADSGFVDLVLPVEDIPAALLAYLA